MADTARAILAIAISILAILAAAAIAVGYSVGPALAVYCGYDSAGKSWTTRSDDIVYEFIHSVHKTMERDVLRADWRGFWLVEVELESFGAGTPYSLDDFGGFGSVEYEGEKVVFRGIKEYRGRSITVDVGVWSEISIIIGGEPVDGCEFVKVVVPPQAG
ncbi:MAG: DUF1850 domain-containing protein [Aeropyrum sp.]|nr:DUF1850 domain-containing protein [Aeropyrum sp.]